MNLNFFSENVDTSTEEQKQSRYEARRKFGEHERCVRVARGVAESNSSFLGALQTSQVLHISMNAQLTHEPSKELCPKW